MCRWLSTVTWYPSFRFIKYEQLTMNGVSLTLLFSSSRTGKQKLTSYGPFSTSAGVAMERLALVMIFCREKIL